MSPTAITLTILLTGIVVVIGGILVLRMHAFLALILGALVVGGLTPGWMLERHALERKSIEVLSFDAETDTAELNVSPGAVFPGTTLLVLRQVSASEGFAEVGRLQIIEREGAPSDPSGKGAAARIVPGLGLSSLSGDEIVVSPADRASAAALSRQSVGERIAEGFGRTAAAIGILIAMAAIIGKCLLDSGAADRIVRSALRLFGEPGAPVAFLLSGFLLGIPVFFDTVFYLMIPLGKAMGMRAGRNYLLYVLTIVAGATMAHSLVPPTPGPLFVAEALGVGIGTMILAGSIVGLFTAASGYVFAVIANRRWELPLRESPDLALADLRTIVDRDESELPPLWLSLVPVLLPVVLIGGFTVLDAFEEQIPASLHQVAAALGDKNIALVLAAVIAMLMLIVQKRSDLRELSSAVQAALASGGVIILITSAGGAFGAVLQQTGVAGLIQDLPQTSPAAILVLAFLITTAIRTAQGSATVAMITAVGVLAGLAKSGTLGFHPVYLALAIGCGSKPIAWMNDSGFWVICKMSGMTEAETLKSITPMTALMGLVGLGVTLIGALLFPLV